MFFEKVETVDTINGNGAKQPMCFLKITKPFPRHAFQNVVLR